MVYNPEKVLAAWKTFVGKEILMKENLQKEVADSWQRCKDGGLDPWSTDFPKSSKELLRQKRKENKFFLKKVHPVLDYLLALFNCNLSICDHEGFVFELITPLNYYPRTLGTYMNEVTAGNGSVNIALKEKKPVRIEGYEHYRIVSQGYSGVSAPIVIDNQLVGILTLTNPFDRLPEYALDCCVEATKIISTFLEETNNERMLLSTPNVFGDLIEKTTQLVIVLDDEGKVLITNTVGKSVIAGYDKLAYGEQSIEEYLINKEDMDVLLNDEVNVNAQKIIRFKKTEDLKKTDLLLLFQKRIYLINGLIQIVLVFESPFEEVKEKTKSIVRNTSEDVDYIGNSTPWKKVDKIVHKVAGYNSSVLLLGETGTGKEVVAKSIHRLSGRQGKFVAINCGAIPRELLESELFGYESGAFTGARAGGSIGKFEYANQGTLFLDEIGEMPLEMQVSLLRVLQEKSITRIGSNKSRPFDVRIIAATNQDVQSDIRQGSFRADLYYRLSVIEITLPLLKERQSDIALLAEFFNKNLSEHLQIPYQMLSDEVIDSLLHYDWPGNVRELRNIIEKSLILSDGQPITVDLFPKYLREPIRKMKTPSYYQVEAVDSEKEQICFALEENNGNVSQTAKQLGIARNTLYRKLKKYNIETKTRTI